MRILFRKLREIVLINCIIRSVLHFFAIGFPAFLNRRVILRWRVSGITKITVGDICFNYYSKCDDHITDTIYFDTYEEMTELILFREFARFSGTILDVGANTGLYSLLAASSNPENIIYGFEPYPFNAKRFSRNITLNKVSNINLIEKAIGAKEGKVSISVPIAEQICDSISANEEMSNKFYREWVTYKQLEVEQTSLDNFCLQTKLSGISLIKIDVDSFELDVLKGSLAILKNHSPIIFCELFVDKSRQDFYNSCLKPLGYYCYMILSSGLVRTEELTVNPDCRDFIFSKGLTPRQYSSYKDMEALIGALRLNPT